MKLLHKRTAKAVGVVLGAAVVTLTTATSSFAASSTHAYTTDDNPGGHAWLRSDGERFYVADNDSDGYRASGYLRFGGNTYRLDDANGASTPSSAGWVSKDFSIAEGASFSIRVCLRDGYSGVAQFCSSWKYGTA